MLSRSDVDSWAGEQHKAVLAAEEKEEWSSDSEDEEVGGGSSSTNTKFLQLDASGKGLTDVTVLSHYRALEELDLSRNKLEGLGSVAELGASLCSLSLAHNPLSSLDGAENLSLLTKLDCCNCGLKSLPPLDGLPELVILLLSGNALTALPVVAAAGTGSGTRERGLRELRIERNRLASAGPADWMAVSGRQLRVLELGAKHPPQKKKERNKDWEPGSDSDVNPLTAEAVTALLGAVAGCCHHLEVLSFPSVGAATRLSRAERKKRAQAKKRGIVLEPAAAGNSGGDGGGGAMQQLHALPNLKEVNGYDWVRDLNAAAAAEAPYPAAAVATGGADAGKGEKVKRPRDEVEEPVEAEAEAEARKKRKKEKKKEKKEKKEKEAATEEKKVKKSKS